MSLLWTATAPNTELKRASKKTKNYQTLTLVFSDLRNPFL